MTRKRSCCRWSCRDRHGRVLRDKIVRGTTPLALRSCEGQCDSCFGCNSVALPLPVWEIASAGANVVIFVKTFVNNVAQFQHRTQWIHRCLRIVRVHHRHPYLRSTMSGCLFFLSLVYLHQSMQTNRLRSPFTLCRVSGRTKEKAIPTPSAGGEAFARLKKRQRSSCTSRSMV